MQRRRIPRLAILGALALLLVLLVPGTAAGAEAPWRSAEAVRQQLFAAQTQLIVGTPGGAAAAVGRARGRYAGALAAGVRGGDPGADRAVRAALRDAARAAARGDAVALAAARTMQGTGWIPISSLDAEPPYWLGLWFGVYPTWETLGAQLAAAGFVIGSFFVAKELKVRRPRRRASRAGAGAAAPAAPAAPAATAARAAPATSPRPGR